MYRPSILRKISAARTHLFHLPWWSIFFCDSMKSNLRRLAKRLSVSGHQHLPDSAQIRGDHTCTDASRKPRLTSFGTNTCTTMLFQRVDAGLNLRMLPTFSPKLFRRFSFALYLVLIALLGRMTSIPIALNALKILRRPKPAIKTHGSKVFKLCPILVAISMVISTSDCVHMISHPRIKPC